MDIILNDKSLDGQFASVDDFADNVFEYTLPLLELIDEKKMRLLKSQSTYNRNVTSNSTLVELFRINSNNTELTMLKRELVAKLCDEPFWEDDSESCLESHYYYDDEELENPSSITEVVERKGILLSFMHNLFKEEHLHIKKDMELCIVHNAYKKEQMLTHFIEKKLISGMEYLQFSKFRMEIVFLNGCIKKSEKTPPNDLQLAIKLAKNMIG